MTRPTVIGVAGGSASGKTSLAAILQKTFEEQKSVVIIRQDDYYRDQSHMPFSERLKTNYDHPLAFDNDLLIKHIRMLMNGESIEKPTYDFVNHTRSAITEVINPCDVLVIEGLFVLEDEEIRSLLDMKLYIDTDADIRFIRRLRRTSMLVMRKIPARGVTWTAGSLASETSRHQYGRENIRHVTFTNNYYMAVFETTQAQWDLIQTERQSPSYFNNTAWRDYRPVEQVCYNEIRMAANNKDADPNAEEWPERPYAGSFLGLLSDKTGIDFDLPTEAQWEFAARAGHGSPYWGDGTAIKNSHNDSNLNLLGRYALNGGWVDSGTSASGASAPAANCDTSRGTAWVGSYKPNSWGLYDMHGNVFEWCIDWFRNVLTTENGYVADPYGTPIAYEYRNYDQRAIRGGSFGGTNSGDADGYFGRSGHCRPAWRQYRRPDYRENFIGFRVVCPADFQN